MRTRAKKSSRLFRRAREVGVRAAKLLLLIPRSSQVAQNGHQVTLVLLVLVHHPCTTTTVVRLYFCTTAVLLYLMLFNYFTVVQTCDIVNQVVGYFYCAAHDQVRHRFPVSPQQLRAGTMILTKLLSYPNSLSGLRGSLASSWQAVAERGTRERAAHGCARYLRQARQHVRPRFGRTRQGQRKEMNRPIFCIRRIAIILLKAAPSSHHHNFKINFHVTHIMVHA